MHMQQENKPIRIVTWNCAGKFREKFHYISQLQADIYIIQECENPLNSRDKNYKDFAANYLWAGDLQYKGLGVFARKDFSLSPLPWPSYCLRHFLPIRINNSFNLLAVWAAHPYIEEYYVYHTINKENIDANALIIGDFNSNQRWDYKHGKRSHSAVVQMMAESNIVSAWHHFHHVEHGAENEPTFYLHHQKQRPYHIDYAFLAPQRIQSCSIIHDDVFSCSDHRPLLLDLIF